MGKDELAELERIELEKLNTEEKLVATIAQVDELEKRLFEPFAWGPSAGLPLDKKRRTQLTKKTGRLDALKRRLLAKLIEVAGKDHELVKKLESELKGK
ncbi:hypothetical protein KY361_07065 [Candidatus Woesearchaeota archaeon]|nr:hypothetical protein [Candidatus Woesearchaeota archaeon]